MIDPGMACHREREQILTRQFVMLKEVFRVAQVPPNIGVLYALVLHHEPDGDDQHGQHDQESKCSAKPRTPASYGLRRACRCGGYEVWSCLRIRSVAGAHFSTLELFCG